MRILEYYIYNGGFWFRICNYGLSITDKIKHPPLFAERMGYRKVLRMGKWGIEFLKPPLSV